ncbi:hypothetical protein RB2331 [Rhodopirellula baltica SH 1]|uniref:Uncharacterized protein n=1 Tax=Rhodopirellula baltica (strain DSM 10527 / NCIMB 13988 / SH1) TaxID=243090 RepID=Q7UW12_RHOBA|nr:hypothetical protein RB2331 [Rhodopirellula baltica SH 1]
MRYMATAQPGGPTQSEPHQPFHLFDLHLAARTHPAVVADLYQVRRHHVLQQVVHETFVCNSLVLKLVSLTTNPASPLSTSCGKFQAYRSSSQPSSPRWSPLRSYFGLPGVWPRTALLQSYFWYTDSSKETRTR